MNAGPPATIDRLKRAFASGDFHTVYELAAEDYTEFYPQSNELIPSRANAVAIDAVYPGGLPTVIGEPRFTDTAAGFVVESTWDYGEGGSYHIVGVCELHEGRLTATRLYFAAPFPPADWRRDWVRTGQVF